MITSWKEKRKGQPKETYPQTLTVRLDTDLRRRLDLVAAALNVSHSDVLRYLLEKYLIDLEGEADLTRPLLAYYIARLDKVQGIIGSEE